MRHKNRNLATIAWFIIKFNLLALPMYAVIIFTSGYEPLRVLTAQVSNAMLNVMGFATTQSGHWIQTQVADVDISWDSTGWKSLYAIAALALATPLKPKARFLAMALPAVFIINILRIATTIAVALVYGLQYFDFVHTFLWREGLITAVVAIWGLWLWREKDNIRKDEGIFRWALGK